MEHNPVQFRDKPILYPCTRHCHQMWIDWLSSPLCRSCERSLLLVMFFERRWNSDCSRTSQEFARCPWCVCVSEVCWVRYAVCTQDFGCFYFFTLICCIDRLPGGAGKCLSKASSVGRSNRTLDLTWPSSRRRSAAKKSLEGLDLLFKKNHWDDFLAGTLYLNALSCSLYLNRF